MKTFGHTKTVEPDQSISYFSGITALEDMGYMYVGDYWSKNPVNGKEIDREIFQDENGKLWAFYNMDHFNTTIYSITIKRFLREKEDLIR